MNINTLETLIFLLIISLSANSKTLVGKIIRVSDGDTVVLLDADNTQHRIRLDGIDCPEKVNRMEQKQPIL